jgi:hypothetical protein
MHLASGIVHPLILAAVVTTLAGCGKSDRPPLGAVVGAVTLDGRPLPEALVLFTPDGRGRTSRALTDADGRYELSYLRDIMGADLGHHAVRITTATDENGGKERLPRRYHSATTLEATVVPGDNTIDFSLLSK